MIFQTITIQGLPLFQAGDDLVRIALEQLQNSDIALEDGDVIAIAQKIVSKVEGRLVHLKDIHPTPEALTLAEEVEKDPKIVELILRESTDIVRKKPGVLIVRHRLGHVSANAGIDQSNIEHDEDGSALLLPNDPDASAARIQSRIFEQTRRKVGVLITDSVNRPWRLGTVGIAIGASHLPVLDDRRGGYDLHGRELKITMISRADSMAAMATLAMGETNEKTPIVIVRGTEAGQPDQPASVINRPLEDDLFT